MQGIKHLGGLYYFIHYWTINHLVGQLKIIQAAW